jgi:predicted small secreted protein
MRKIVVLAMLAASVLVAACNTVEGAGRDVSAAGKAVSNTADDAKHYTLSLQMEPSEG